MVVKKQGLSDRRIFPNRLLKRYLEIFGAGLALFVIKVAIGIIRVNDCCMIWVTPIVGDRGIFMRYTPGIDVNEIKCISVVTSAI